MNDPVNHPAHYTAHPSGVECIQVTEHMGFCVGNAIKYLWRAGLKGPTIQDLEKARWYIDREIDRQKRLQEGEKSTTIGDTSSPCDALDNDETPTRPDIPSLFPPQPDQSG